MYIATLPQVEPPVFVVSLQWLQTSADKGTKAPVGPQSWGCRRASQADEQGLAMTITGLQLNGFTPTCPWPHRSHAT